MEARLRVDMEDWGTNHDINQRQDNWYYWLSIAEFTYNDWVHASTQTSTFMLDVGPEPMTRVRTHP